MKNLFDILLDQILKGEMEAKKPKKKGAKSTQEQVDEIKTLKDKAETEVKKRAKKRLEEKFAKSEKQAEEALANAKRKKREATKEANAAEEVRRQIDLLEAPTGRAQWECVGGNMGHLVGRIGKSQVFEIKRGILTYKLQLSSVAPGKSQLSLAERAKKVGLRNNFSLSNVYLLKEKAEKVLLHIETLEKQALELAKKQNP